MRIGFLGGGFPDAQRALVDLLPHDEVGSAEELGAVDVLVPAMGRVDREVLDSLRPRLVQQYGAGIEGVDLDAARERAVAVANIPAGMTGNAAGVSEIAVLHLLALARGLREARDTLDAGRLGEPMGFGLDGRTVTILGVGDIGREVAIRLRGFGMKLVGVGHSAQPRDGVADLIDEYLGVDDLHGALSDSDDVVVCLPLSDQTRGIVGEAELGAMRGGGFLVNVGRGPLVKYEALLSALRSGRLRGAGLDVFWDEPIDPADPLLAENVSATPHIGGLTERAWWANAQGFADNVNRLRDGEELRGRIV
ncbi:MAG: NAD(P)-dependent oxidoreductase [Thermoleophilaceae bacterium]